MSRLAPAVGAALGYWNFDDQANPTADTGSGNQAGALTSGAFADGLLGYAGDHSLVMNGTGTMMRVDDTASGKYKIQVFTFETTIQAHGDYQAGIVASYDNATMGYYGWKIYWGVGGWITFMLISDIGAQPFYVSTYPTVYKDTDRHHIVCANGGLGGNLEICVDGRFVASAASGTAVWDTNMYLHLGCDSDTDRAWGRFKGKIDNSILWPSALTTADALAHYGWPHNYMGIRHELIGKINGINVGSIKSVNGIV